MECEHQKMSRNDNEICQFYSSRKELLFFLFNTLNLILNDGENCCYCKKFREKRWPTEKNCEMCKIPVIFQDFEKVLTANMFNNVFLWKNHSQLLFHLYQILKQKKVRFDVLLVKNITTLGETVTRGEDGVSLKANLLNMQWKIKWTKSKNKIWGLFLQRDLFPKKITSI